MKKVKLLFICSGNLDRNPTAEDIFISSSSYIAKSAGTDSGAKVRVTQKLLDWADEIFVMSEKEDGHLTFLKDNFNIRDKKIHDLNIPDVYDRDDPKLIAILCERLSRYLNL